MKIFKNKFGYDVQTAEGVLSVGVDGTPYMFEDNSTEVMGDEVSIDDIKRSLAAELLQLIYWKVF